MNVTPREAIFTEALRDKQLLQAPRITPWGDTLLVGTNRKPSA